MTYGPCSRFSLRIYFHFKQQGNGALSSHFVSPGNLFLLPYLTSWLVVRKGEPDIAAAAVEATTKLLAKGTSFEHQKLLKGDVFSVALELYNTPQRQLSLELLRAIISHLSYVLLTYDEFAVDMCSLFE